MKRLKRDPATFETLDLYRALSREGGYSLESSEGDKAFIETLEESFAAAKDRPITLHGLRVESMFEYVAVGLDKCKLVKHEDAGEIYAEDEELTPPDFRLVLKSGREFFVEVKSFHQTNPWSPFRLKPRYVKRYQRYAQIFEKEVKVATYWSGWNIWTLVPISLFKKQERYSLPFKTALMKNEMILLGDRFIGVKPPLIFRVLADPDKPRRVEESGQVLFTIGGVEVRSGDAHIENTEEQSLVMYFMFYGDWFETTRAETVDDELVGVDFTFEPADETPDQEFEIVGSLSGMISRRFNIMTAPTGKVERLVPRTDPEYFRIELPDDCRGDDLPLFCLEQLPSWDWAT